MPEVKSFRDRMNYELEKRGWNQRYLARKVGVDLSYLNRWLGRGRMTRRYKLLIAEVLGLSPEDSLFDGVVEVQSRKKDE